MTSNSRWMIAAALASAVVLAAAAPLTAQQTPTLGQLALKEQERRKALKGSGKVLADLPKGPATPAPQAVPATAKDPAAEEKAADKAADKKEEPKDEAWWRQRMSQAREELRRSEMFAEALQTRINSLSNDFSARDDPYQRARVAEDRQKALAEMDRVRTDVEAQKKKIADIEEEARQAGVPPGWVR